LLIDGVVAELVGGAVNPGAAGLCLDLADAMGAGAASGVFSRGAVAGAAAPQGSEGEKDKRQNK
jgi:hypothetical protein